MASEREEVEKRIALTAWRGDQASLDFIVDFAMSERARVWEEAGIIQAASSCYQEGHLEAENVQNIFNARAAAEKGD